MKKSINIIIFILTICSIQVVAMPPPLPMGLETSEQAALPPELKKDANTMPFDLTGFLETRFGMRLQNDPTQKQTSLGEGRLHLSAIKTLQFITANLTTDFIYNPVLGRHTIDLKNGEGWLDMREANILFTPLDFADIKMGRQIITWGTGDLLFINDLFPKDWNSFFLGRDEEYLKAPSDAVKIALYHDTVNLDAIYVPCFNEDRFINGRSISYFNSNAGRVVGRNHQVQVEKRVNGFSDDEIALRLHRLVGAYETAFYFYNGYWKSPGGQDTESGLFTFPRLSAYGASARGPFKSGIMNIEMGYYDSRDDNDGGNALINNSEWRFLLGYEREVLTDLTASMQYYLEVLAQYKTYCASLPSGAIKRDEYRHIITVRLTQMLMNQNLIITLFNFYSPSDEDGYLRSNIKYKFDDNVTFSAGSNWFYGKKKNTFFGQFKENSNIYISLRYAF